MDAAFSEGFPFDLGDVWAQSTFLSDERSAALFTPLDTTLPALEVYPEKSLFGQDFDLPELGPPDGTSEERRTDLQSEINASLQAAPLPGLSAESEVDVWSLDTSLNRATPIPCLRTWEGFDKKGPSNPERTAFLSEAGQSVFDAVVQRIEKRHVDVGILPQDVLLRALFNLALGRSSLFFRWDAENNSFARTLANVPISGHSVASSESVVQRVVECGTRFRNLDHFSRSAHAKKQFCTARTALKGSIIKALNGIEKRITEAIAHTRSLPQLSKLIERPCELLRILEELTDAARGLNNDEDVISVISDIMNASCATQPLFAGVLQTLLARVSAPWLERLCVDLGLREDSLSQRLLEYEAYENDTLHSADLSANPIESNQEALPNFIDKDDRALILECKRSLASLRKQLPDNTLTFPHANYNYAMLFENGEFSIPKGECDLTSVLAKQENLAWSDPEAQNGYMSALDSRMSQSLATSEEALDELQATTAAALVADASSVSDHAGLDRYDFNPLEKLRPLIQAHAKLINATVLRHVFWTCRLKDHLDIQHQYHLFGNGDFVARLSTALFSDETQSAERKKGNVPTGQTMGLRLGSRDEQRWPPASSELRLTLAGVLTETYRHTASMAVVATAHVKELPGGLSFSIRELPDEEIERVLDSGSLYALDFLRMQYYAPPGLEAVITKSCIQTYDAIFRQLLRVLRMLDIVTKLKERTRVTMTARNTHVSREAKFANDAHHFVSVLMSHMLDIGIRSPWRAFLVSVGQVEAALTTENEQNDNELMTGLDDLRRLHEQCLESIRARIFLRQKYQKVQSAIDEVFTAVLRGSSLFERDEGDLFASSATDFENKVASVLTILRTTINRAGKAKMSMSTADSDNEALSLLVARLDWNGYYTV